MDRLVFLDESGLNLAMGRSHAWVRKGEEFVARRPMDWGKNVTLIGAVRLSGWVVQTSMPTAINADRFVKWLRTRLLPRLKAGDVLVMDNLRAHRDPRVKAECKRWMVRVIYQSPYSPDFNPIEAGWALQKQYVRRVAPRTSVALLRVARRARYRIKPRHCRQWFAHAGY